MYLYIKRKNSGEIETNVQFGKTNYKNMIELCVPDGCSVDCENGIFINGIKVNIDENGNLIGNREELENMFIAAQTSNTRNFVRNGIGSMRGGNVEFNF